MNGRFGVMGRKSRGQAMTEYIIIVSLVAIACIAVVTAFGKQIANLFKRSTDALGSGSVQATVKEDTGNFTGISDSSGGGAAGGAGAGS